MYMLFILFVFEMVQAAASDPKTSRHALGSKAAAFTISNPKNSKKNMYYM